MHRGSGRWNARQQSTERAKAGYQMYLIRFPFVHHHNFPLVRAVCCTISPLLYQCAPRLSRFIYTPILKWELYF